MGSFTMNKEKKTKVNLFFVFIHIKSVFKAPLMNLRQLENKVFKNSTGF